VNHPHRDTAALCPYGNIILAKMKFDPKIHHRRSIRLKGYDYTQSGAYYITIVTYQRQHLFGEVVDGVMCLNELGQIAQDEWFKTTVIRPYVELSEDEFVVMPNHVHGIIWIHNNIVRSRRRRDPTDHDDNIEQFGKPVSKSIPTIVRAYKSAVTYAVNALQNQRGATLWQRNYYEHIIRDEKDLQAKRNYILGNPMNWEDDDENVK
jgi:REP-associated tyrosine transposase